MKKNESNLLAQGLTYALPVRIAILFALMVAGVVAHFADWKLSRPVEMMLWLLFIANLYSCAIASLQVQYSKLKPHWSDKVEFFIFCLLGLLAHIFFVVAVIVLLTQSQPPPWLSPVWGIFLGAPAGYLFTIKPKPRRKRGL